MTKTEDRQQRAEIIWDIFMEDEAYRLANLLEKWTRLGEETPIDQYTGENPVRYFMHMDWEDVVRSCMNQGLFDELKNPQNIIDPTWLRNARSKFIAACVEKGETL